MQLWRHLILSILIVVPAHASCWSEVFHEVARSQHSQTVRWRDGRESAFTRVDGALRFDGVPAVRFLPPNSHHAGIQNAGIYRIQRGNEPRLIKILGDDSKSSAHYLPALRGTLLGALADGPTVFAFGRVQMLSGRIGFYVEMEHLFEGQITDSWKGLIAECNDACLVPALNRLRAAMPIVVRRFLRIFERNLATGPDIDFIFTARDMRWVDTADWRQQLQSDVRLVRGLQAFLGQLRLISASDVPAFAGALRDAVGSAVLIPDERRALIMQALGRF